MKRFLSGWLVVVGLCLLLQGYAHAQAVANQFDACAQFPKSYAAININTATDTQLVALQANMNIYVCGYFLNQVNGTGSLGFEYGTGTNCGTGKTALQGVTFASTVASGVTNTLMPFDAAGGTQLQIPAGKALCAITTGTIQQSGWVTYVQAPATNAASFFDPCNVYQKSSATINFSSATTSELIAPAATGQQTYVCNIFLEDAGRATTANTTQFEYGTKASTACDTGATAISGPITGTLTAGTPSFIGPAQSSGTDFTVASGKELCAVTTQSSTVTGFVTYVQK